MEVLLACGTCRISQMKKDDYDSISPHSPPKRANHGTGDLPAAIEIIGSLQNII